MSFEYDDPNEEYLTKKAQEQGDDYRALPGQTHPLITADNKLRIQGLVLQRILREGPPKYVIGWSQNKVIYAVAYHWSELQPKCHKLARVKRCDPKEVMFTEINGKSLHDSMKAKGLKPEQIVPDRIYESQQHPNPL